NDFCWRIPKSYKAGMRVDGLIYADDQMIELIRKDQAPEQVANVAFLPGIQHASLAMPDIHWGYGFCIGGVAATDPDEGGVISPGGVGYDINCGVRLVRSNLHEPDVRPVLTTLMDQLYARIPAGVGQEGKYHFPAKELRQLMGEGVGFLKKRGLATESDIEHTEARGHLRTASPDDISERALTRGATQCGTLGSGNHFLEVQVVDQVFDDALRSLRSAPAKYGIRLPDQQLVCAPIGSKEGEHYLGVMCAAANYAWCNRQLLMWQAREAFEAVFNRGWEHLHMSLVYDVAHNIAKFEEHEVGGQKKRLWVHRKGATRAFPAKHPEVPSMYRGIGQPVIIPGDMGRASWVLAGQSGSMEQTFGTACHGAGRVMSRTAAIKHAQGRRIDEELAAKGIIARARSWKGLAEEQPDAYKDVDLVVEIVHRA